MIKLAIQFYIIKKVNLLKLHLKKLNSSKRILIILKMFKARMYKNFNLIK